ncbi:MAG: hypothetical protein ACPGLY_11340 [Rubripirellula sp.]
MQYSPQGGKRPRGKRSKVAGVAVALLFILYTAIAPRANERFGWKLPVPGETQQVAEQGPRDLNVTKSQPPSRSNPNARSNPANMSAGRDDVQRSAGGEQPFADGGESANKAMDPRRDWLRETSPNVFLSPAGLIYGPGSAEGHRLEHVRRHAADLPRRPGPHGVFDGGFLASLKTIDDAWKLAKQSVQTEKEVDGRRTIYKVDLQRKIGFVGGRTGNSRGQPPVTVVLLVLEGNRVITAYPVESQ